MSEPPNPLWQVLEAQVDDMFALYQLAQLLTEATDLEELVQVALPQLVRVSDSRYAALFLQAGPEPRQELVAWMGPGSDGPRSRNEETPPFDDGQAAMEWFQAACGLDARDCVALPLDVGRELPGLLTLAPSSRNGFSRHQHHLIATMAREMARALQLALARSDLQRRQQQVEQMQADFVAAVSHELRTPLALTQASLDSLTHLELTPEQQRRFIQDIGQSTAELSRLVHTILDFSRVEEGHWSVHLQATDLAKVAERTTREAGSAAQRRLIVDVPPIEVQADAERLGQVVGNLLTNALKYSPPDTPVRLRARSAPSRGVAWLDVHDQGEGIPAEDVPYLFQKFFRARNVRTSTLPGTGLGLYMAKRLVEAQGGSIRLRSRLGRGTVVRVYLPLA